MKIKISLILFFSIIFVFVFLNYDLISKLKQLPSPIYGGDLYYHLGMMYHILDGGSIFENSQLLNETPWAPFFYQLLIVIIAKIFGISLIIANLYSSLFFMIISSLIIYFLSKEIFKNDLISLLPVCLILSNFPVFKYSYFTEVVVMPLFFYLLFKALKHNNKKYYIFAGISFGLIGISHVMAFFMACVFILLIFLYLFFFGEFEKEKYFLKISKNAIALNFSNLKNNLINRKYFFLLIIIGFLISQLYWFKPIFVHHLSTENKISEYDQTDFSSVNILEYTMKSLQEIFVRSDNIFYLTVSIFSILGIFYIALKKKSFEEKYLLLILSALILSRFHYLITFPLFGTDFFSRLMVSYIFTALQPFLFTFGILMIIEKFKISSTKILVIVVILTAIISIKVFDERIKSDIWIKTGMQQLPEYIYELSDWIRKNTDVYDVFASTNEISFMLNGISGRKVLNSRRAHSGMYVNVDKRWADAAVLFYGNNSEKISEIIKKYKIKYLYWQANWVSLDFEIDENGNIKNIFDPLLIKYTKEYEEYLSKNGVKYIKVNFWLDPANRNPDVKRFDSLLVLPYKIDDFDPFSPELKKHLKEIKEFKYNNITIGKIYEVVA